MPLKQNPGSDIDTSQMNEIRVTMLDGNLEISVIVSAFVLYDLAAREQVHLSDPLLLLNRYRLEVEQAASRKYDALERSHREIVLHDEDFN
jgi:Protein of unknown function (DUF1488)